jgi:hypothetical protein
MRRIRRSFSACSEGGILTVNPYDAKAIAERVCRSTPSQTIDDVRALAYDADRDIFEPEKVL